MLLSSTARAERVGVRHTRPLKGTMGAGFREWSPDKHYVKYEQNPHRPSGRLTTLPQYIGIGLRLEFLYRVRRDACRISRRSTTSASGLRVSAHYLKDVVMQIKSCTHIAIPFHPTKLA